MLAIKSSVITRTIKTVLALGFALLFSGVLAQTMFPYDSPRVRRNLEVYLFANFDRVKSDPTVLVEVLPFGKQIRNRNNTKEVEKMLEREREALEKAPLRKQAPGVYVKSTPNVHYVQAVTDEIRWKEVRGIVEGKEVVVMIQDEGHELSKEDVEQILLNHLEN